MFGTQSNQVGQDVGVVHARATEQAARLDMVNAPSGLAAYLTEKIIASSRLCALFYPVASPIMASFPAVPIGVVAPKHMVSGGKFDVHTFCSWVNLETVFISDLTDRTNGHV